jgi:CheY-like chemotaxis protein
MVATVDSIRLRPRGKELKLDMTRILLIDDEEPVRLTLGEMLRLAGHEVVTAGDGQEGLERFRERAFDLVVTDVVMPRKSGAETILELRRLRPGLKIIAIYAGGRISGMDSGATAQDLGADRLLAKPFTREELLAAVTGLLDAAKDKPAGP